MSESCDLTLKHCVPCQGGLPPLTESEIRNLIPQVPQWSLKHERAVSIIERTFEFPDFVKAMAFVNRVADAAELEGHHPDFHIHYNQVRIVLWTHKIGGLHENDFILAAKIDRLLTLRS